MKNFITDSLRKEKIKLNFHKSLKLLKDISEYANGMLFLSKIGKEIKDKSNQGPILINNVDYCQYQTLFFESLLAAKFRRMGFNSKILIDDGVLRHIDMETYEKMLIGRKFSIREKLFGIILKKFRYYVRYSDLIEKTNLSKVPDKARDMIEKDDFRYAGVDLREYIEASVIKAFRSVKGLVEKELKYNHVLHVCTENAIISIMAAKGADERYEPETIITSHGIYSTYGPFYKYFKTKSNKNITVWGYNPYKYGTVQLSKTGIVASKTDDGFFNASKERINVSQAEEFAETIMDKRFKCESDDHMFFGSKIGKDEELIGQIETRSKGKKVYALFTNVLWDDSMVGIDTIFPSAMEWIIKTIEYFCRQKDKLLIIRAHPDEMFSQTRITVKELIESHFNAHADKLNNCIFIPSENRLSSYTLFSQIDAGIVYNGTIGLEMIYKDIPVIIAARAPYSCKNLTYDIDSIEEYFMRIEDIAPVLKAQKDGKKDLSKYIYYAFKLHGIPLNVFSTNRWASPDIKIGKTKIINDANLTHIAEVILGDRNFFQDWERFLLKKGNH